MKTTVGWGMVASVALVAAACNGGGVIELQELAEESGRVTCAKMFECCSDAELMAEFEITDVETEQDCVEFYTSFIGGLLTPQLEASVEAGRMEYDGAAAADCYDTMAAMSCEEFAAVQSGDAAGFEGCGDFFIGQQGEGDPCAGDHECDSDYCEGDEMDFEGNVTEGVCATKPGVGDSCEVDRECTEDAYCEFGQDGDVCAARKADGAECNSDDECQSDNCAGADPQNGTPGSCSSELVCDGK